MGQNISLPKVSIVMLNLNRFSLTSNCIESLEKLTYPNYEIIVVDNGSTDKSPQMLKKAFPRITLIQTGKRMGYCKGFNVGIREALKNNADYVFLAHNDAKDFSKNYLEEIVKVFERDEKIGLVGSKVLDFDGNKVWWGEDCEKLGVVRNTPDCGFVVRSKLLKEIGLLDEDFVAFFEDLDFIIRLRKAQYKTAFVPSVKFAHSYTGTMSRVDFDRHYYRVRNIFLFLKKHGAEMSLLCKARNIILLMRLHIVVVIWCFIQGKIEDLIRVTGAILRGFIDGLFLFYKK